MSRIEGNVYANGNISAKTMTLPAGTVTNTGVADAAGIAATKLDHQHRIAFSQESATTAADVARVVHQVRGATGTIIAFAAGCVVPCVGDSTIAVDLLKNGVSILSTAAALSVAEAAYAVAATTIATAALVAGDVLEIEIVGTIGTGTLGLGVFAAVTIEEKAQ